MALVRRTTVLGSNSNRVVAAATVAPANLAQPPAAAPAPTAAPAGAGSPAPTDQEATQRIPAPEMGAAVTVGPDAPPPAPGSEAAAVTTQPAGIGSLIAAFVLVAAGGAGSWSLYHYGINADEIHLPDATALFGVLFAFATAVERVLEPFARFMPGRHAKGDLEKAVANMANKYHDATLDDLIQVAHAKSMVDRGRADRGLISWGIAVALATVASASGGLYLLHSIAGDGWHGIPVWIDAIITGVVVGSGTKPLHDVISKVQKNKEKSEDTTAA
ncbi:hypothetical protein GCM10020218_036640 [Dactylosporangium vinaceum]|uniref:Uncharacterized protein n=1 Tax=Dactylosporangium vinaceum TaxID=53362 RepID=A0ABV5MB61_9ACTN|nr:hypothetical protein [Dactylosporangium vinaceum]